MASTGQHRTTHRKDKIRDGSLKAILLPALIGLAPPAWWLRHQVADLAGPAQPAARIAAPDALPPLA
ncbi:hypothetical protein [Streptomyces sp. TLI_146]|uniref:hypothetical protein n=1 Tax=Streptomyces sp. TLI_146 TaxID=1938858 RepID=UPI000C70B731|nr:hypothetical protein [Streptomyces sp. TLI_146]PKV89929.1 hypothetical protein BX283_7577 [Streptomyces sp. TLI_146]